MQTADPPHRPRRPARRRLLRRGARGLQGPRGSGGVHRPLRAVAHPRDAASGRRSSRSRTRSARSATPSRPRPRSSASRPRPAAAPSLSPGRPRERRGEHRRTAAAEGRHPALRAGRPLGLPERRDRGAGLRERGEVEEAVREARSGSTVAQVLVENGTITEEQLARATAERYGLAYIDLEDFEVDPRRRRDDPAVRRQALPGRAGRIRRRRPAGRDDRPGRHARGERHRRDDEARGAARPRPRARA